MATQFANGKIVTDGLVLCLDAADRTSYLGSGTTWFDLAGSNNGTLVNNPTFNSNGATSSIVFDGTDDYVGTSVARNATTNQNYTINIVFKIISFTGSDMRLFGATDGITDQLCSGWDGTTFRIWVQASWNNTNFVSSTGVTYHLTMVHEGTDNKIYVNGLFNSNITNKTSYFNNLGFCNPYILSYGTFFSGNIYNAQIYNRALTESEVRQNYNAQKGRFGLS